MCENLKRFKNTIINVMMTDNREEQNINFFFEDLEPVTNSETNKDILDVDFILQEICKEELYNISSSPETMGYIENYINNYTVKELLVICDYYGFAKNVKVNKSNKQEIAHLLVEFETNPINNYIVCKRKNMWFYVNELKNDKFMKKYVLL